VPHAFHVLVKPAGAVCNLACRYCYFLSKADLYPGSRFRMPDGVLETYVRQLLEAQAGREVFVAWQGGEPTLMGLSFFRRSIELVEQHRKAATDVRYTIQTNGVLLDDEWCEFFREHRFLVGLSLDGPRALHDVYRVDKHGRGTFDAVVRAARLLQHHRVDVNILACVHAASGDHPIDVYRFLRDEVGARFIQFIPIVERAAAGEAHNGEAPTAWSVRPAQWAGFLTAIFDEWVRRDVGVVFVQQFDAALASWTGVSPGVCVFMETCGDAVALEHNGDLYCCDHFVDREYLLGNILQTPMPQLVASDRLRAFGDAKRDALPRYCRQCHVRFACRGECPKNRFVNTPDGEPGLNYLCEGYKAFFAHVGRPMRMMADLLRHDRAPAEIMWRLRREDEELRAAVRTAGRNQPCPCGSERKVKQCHGR
jgi:uncharacterized protein